MSISAAIANAVSGLTAASRGTEIVSTNIANSQTEGYARRELELSSRLYERGGGVVINGTAHGRGSSAVPTTTCQLHMRSFADGATVDVEPWRSGGFPVIKDLVVDRSAFDRIIQAGGYVSVNTGSAPEANAAPVGKLKADRAFDAATCIGCGACVAACPNGSAMLFTSAKITHLAMLPQGQPERWSRVKGMVAQHDAEGFGGCTNIGECAAVCPKEIPLDTISQLNRDLMTSLFKKDK